MSAFGRSAARRPRTRGKQRHDELEAGPQALLGSGALGTRRKVAPHIGVTVGLDFLHGVPGSLPARTAHGAWLTRAQVRELLCRATLTRLVLDAKRRVVDVSHTQRTSIKLERLLLGVQCGGGPQDSREAGRAERTTAKVSEHRTATCDVQIRCVSVAVLTAWNEYCGLHETGTRRCGCMIEAVGASYRPRLADAYLRDLVADFPAVMITGARATGKTTTAQQHAAAVVRLDQPGTAAAFRADPDAALRRAVKPLLIDEWQEVPAVLAAVKRAVDADAKPGQFVLTGSVRAELGTEMWAGTGRVVRMSMYGLAERELVGPLDTDRTPFLARLAASGVDDLVLPAPIPDIDDYIGLAVRGGFPEVAYRVRSDRSRRIWSSSYLGDLVTRDAAAVGQVKDPAKLRAYLNVLALNTAGLPTDKTLSEAAGVNARTAAGYDRLLANLYVLELVPAWPMTTNRLKALVKAPKRYLIDTGLAATAATLTREAILDDADLLGRFFDAFALAQLRPELALMDPVPVTHHLRTHGGRQEVDAVFDLGRGRAVALEFKAANAVGVADAKHLFTLRTELGERFLAGAVLHTGPDMFELGERIYAVPLCAIWG